MIISIFFFFFFLKKIQFAFLNLFSPFISSHNNPHSEKLKLKKEKKEKESHFVLIIFLNNSAEKDWIVMMNVGNLSSF